MEMMQKNVAELSAGETLARIDALYLAGMRVAMLSGSCSDDELQRLCNLVKETFYAHNDPIGLMLRLTPEMDTPPLSVYQYVLLEGFSPAELRLWKSRNPEFTGSLLTTAAKPGDWSGADGVMTADPETAAAARAQALLVLTDNPTITADGLLWHAGTPADTVARRQEALRWDEEYLHARLEAAEADALFGPMAALLAMKTGAKAILVFTDDGSNLPQISSLYPPIPIIAVAKRPEGEGMLLCQTMRWSTLPTAITRTPESMDVEGFARFVAELYGYPRGDAFVALGHWVPGQNRNQLCCFTL